MNEEQQIFLDRKIVQLSEKQPEVLLLRSQLLKIGGVQLVAPSKPDPDLRAVVQDGFLQTDPCVLEEYERNGCHWNVAVLWLRNRLTAIGTGYALSEDGLWRQHSWGIQSDSLIETTEVRTHYFGVRLAGADADRFASLYFDS